MNKSHKLHSKLKDGEYFITTITILELDKKYTNSKNKDVYKYKTTKDSYIPYFHSYKPLESGKTYEIKGYKYKDGLHIVDISNL